jgi:YfiH family protein
MTALTVDMFKPEWHLPANVRALYSTRAGGVSQSPFDSFNLAEHVGDDPDRVKRNREILQSSQDLPSPPCWLEQTHSTTAVILESDQNRLADAAITRQHGKVAVVMTADCLPILLCNQSGTEVAAVHAGWRGLLDGVVEETIATMQSPANQLLAWIGPAISQAKFEVGDEVRQAFVDKHASADQRFISNPSGHWFCDLPSLGDDLLSHHGLAEITQSNLCSYANEEIFYSYRRNAVTGRMASLIWLQSDA